MIITIWFMLCFLNVCLGMPGLTAYVGLKEIGQPKPGEEVFVTATVYNLWLKAASLKEAHNLIKNSVLCDFLLAAKDLWN